MLAGEIVAIPDNVDAGKMRYRKVGTRTQPVQDFRGYAFVTPEGLVIQFDAHASQPRVKKSRTESLRNLSRVEIS
jgi:hypothetical protein